MEGEILMKKYISKYQKKLTETFHIEIAVAVVCALLFIGFLFLIILGITPITISEATFWDWVANICGIIALPASIVLFAMAHDTKETLDYGRFWADWDVVYFAGTITKRFSPRSVKQDNPLNYLKNPQFTVSIFSPTQTREIVVDVSDNEFAMYKVGESVYLWAEKYLDTDGALIKYDNFQFLPLRFTHEYSCEITDIYKTDDYTTLYLRCMSNHQLSFVAQVPAVVEVPSTTSIQVTVREHGCFLTTIEMDILPGYIFNKNGELMHIEQKTITS